MSFECVANNYVVGWEKKKKKSHTYRKEVFSNQSLKMYLIHINADVSCNFGRSRAVICENGFCRLAVSVLIILWNSNRRAAPHISRFIYVEIVDAYESGKKSAWQKPSESRDGYIGAPREVNGHVDVCVHSTMLQALFKSSVICI